MEYTKDSPPLNAFFSPTKTHQISAFQLLIIPLV